MRPTSPSAIATARRCLRKLAYQRSTPRGPDTPAQAFGKRAHKSLELWQAGRKPPDLDTPEGIAVMPAIARTPQPQTGAKPEHKFRFDFEGHPYIGYCDLLTVAAPYAVVTDYKFPGSFRYVEPLDDNPQSIVYSFGAFLENPDVTHVASQWIYSRRGLNPPQAREDVLVRERGETWDRFERLHNEETVRIAAIEGVDPKDVPRNTDACRDFGGCPYAPQCLGRWTTIAEG